MSECTHNSQVYLEEVIARKNERLAALEKVAEAGAAMYKKGQTTDEVFQREADHRKALREAGYLGGVE